MKSQLRTWSDRLNWALKERRVKPAELARACHIERASVSEWTTGDTKNPKLEPFFRACDYLRVRPRWLALGEGPADAETTERHSELVRAVAREVAKRAEDAQRKVLELVLQIPEEPVPRPSSAVAERPAKTR